MKLSIKNLSIGYSGKTVLKDLNLQAQSGDFIVLLGKNGAGKSTLIKSLAGIIPLIKGKILINEDSLSGFTGKKRAKFTGVVLTDKIDLNLKVYEFIGLGRQVYTGHFDNLTAIDKQVIEKVIDKLDLSDFIYHNLQELSDGERQKILIARVLVQETPIILLDEPTVHLDLENKAMIFKLLKELAIKENKIIILSTHDLNLILPVVDKIWLVNQHHISEMNHKSKDIIKLFASSPHIRFDEDCGIYKLD